MTLEDIRKLATRQTLFRLDSILGPRLVPILYALGLSGIVLWIIRHLFATFGSGFGHGLWGLLEIAVFGLFAFVTLRIACEGLLVYFKAHETATDQFDRARLASASLLDEVRDAIHDLAEETEEPAIDDLDYTDADDFLSPDPDDEMDADSAADETTRPKPVRRTARRLPKERL